MDQDKPDMPDDRDLRLARLEAKLSDLESRLPTGFRDAFDSTRTKLSNVALPIAPNDPVTRPHPVAEDHFDFDAVITGSNTSGTLYKWQQLYLGSAFNGLTSSIMTSGLRDTTGAAVELNGTRFVSVGTKVRMRGSYGTDATKFSFAAAAIGAFAVYLTQNGGANGTDDTGGATPAFPTYTYNVFTDASKTIQIGTAVAVDFHRFLQVAVTPAGHGIAQYINGTLHLLTVDEYWDRADC